MTEEFAPPPTLGAPAAPERDRTPDAGAATASRAPRTRRRRRGNRLAWIVGGAAAVAILGGVVADLALEARARALEPAQRGDTGPVASIAVVAGLCFEDLPAADGPVGTVTAVPCTDPHRAEAIADYTFTGEDWPGAEAVAAAALDFCDDRVARVVSPGIPGVESASLEWRVWAPSAQTWAAGDRDAVCLVVSETPMVGTLERGDVTPA